MFCIRGIYDDALPVNRAAIAQVQDILRVQFPLLREGVILEIPERLRNPLKFQFRSMLFVAEGAKAQVKGFAFLAYEPELRFCYLDYVATAKNMLDRGIGGSLYERVRQEALRLQVVGLFFECLPDDPALCSDPVALKQNAARLRFYERYGARPIVGTAYESPITPQSQNPPYLVFDDLGRNAGLPREQARVIVRAILEREYGHVCSKQYIDKVVESFRDPGIRLREPKYRTKELPPPRSSQIPPDLKIALVVNDRHGVHEVRDRGYVEAPVRITTILKEIGGCDLFTAVPPRNYPLSHILTVHDSDFVKYLKRVCENVPEGESVYPYVFPLRNAARPPKELAVRAGYYCIDTFTPLNRRAYAAAERAVDCALTAADAVLSGRPAAYALVRPPGHHAERRAFGGFCYFNSAAVAAQRLSASGKVAILDVDYHHGNGQQDIFYDRADVLTVSIHGHPRIAYPYFSGFEDEKGLGPGEGFNLNFPLPETVDGPRYRETLQKALQAIAAFRPTFLVVALGLDTAKGDPTGTWTLRAADFEANGRLIGALKLPTLVVQEGGYNTRSLGANARRFFLGLWSALQT
ncbi:MAG: histone deacetylase family protein [Pirellulales bacterium]|nr:histone deacetylase family protein [Pirellulales bacterium]